jgi:hypothetical protein
MGSVVVDRDFIDNKLFDVAVPKWLFTKFTDGNFTSNLKSDCMTLLFPKNNYLKAIAFSTKELLSEPFLTQNKLVLQKSGGIITLARTDFSFLFPEIPAEAREQVEKYLDKYQWVLTNPTSADEILALRESGKMAPVFREVQPPKISGRNPRPESETSRTCRLVGNTLGKIQASWNGMMNFVVSVANPRTEFWSGVFDNADGWEVTPTNSIYNCIRAEENLNPLENLRNAKSKDLQARIGYIVAQNVHVPYGTEDCGKIVAVFQAMTGRQDFHKFEDFVDKIDVEHPMSDMAVLKDRPVTQSELTAGKLFLGLKTKAARQKRPAGSAVRLHSSVLNELKPLKENPIYDKVVNWLMSTFKSNSRTALQLIAAERILGEALRHQDTVFLDLEDDDLLEVEEYYEDD